MRHAIHKCFILMLKRQYSNIDMYKNCLHYYKVDREREKKDTVVEKEDLLFVEKSKRKVNWDYNISEMSVLLDSMVF